jgi:V/A-type H+-transporting ATPase subunit E
MPLSEIVAKISGDGQKQAQSLMDKARAEAEQYLKQAKAEIEAQAKQLMKEGEQRAARQKKQRLQIATLDARKRVLAEKQALIARVFEQALKELEQLELKKYAAIINNMLAGYPLVGDEEIIVSRKDRQRLGEGFIAQLNQRLKSQGKKGNCSWSKEERPLRGGFIIRRGKIEANCFFESLLKSQQEELEQQVAKVLFG